MTATSRSVAVTVSDALAIVRISREHGNAIDSDMVDGLRAVCRDLAGRSEVRGVMLAAGGPLFCPGLDLRELIDYDRTAMNDFMTRFGEAVLSLFTLPKPLVAAISGHALAGGCLMAVTADRRILRRGCKVGLNAIRVGLPLPFGMALILREAVHSSRLEEAALLGRNYADEQAVEAGIVHEVHDGENFETFCLERLEQMASREGGAFATTKRYLRSATVERIRAHDAEYRDEFLDCWFAEPTRRRMERMVDELQRRG